MDLLVDFVGVRFGLLEGHDEHLVVQDVPSGVVEHLQDLVLGVDQLLPVLEEVSDVLLPLVLLVLLLHLEDSVQHVLLEARGGHHEAQEVDLDTDLRGIMGVRHLGRQVELEVRVVVDHVLPELDLPLVPYLDPLVLKDRLINCVQLLSYVLH